MRTFSGASDMFPTASECHRDYELTRILIRTPAITPCSDPHAHQLSLLCLSEKNKLNNLNIKMITSSVPTSDVIMRQYT